MDSYAPVDSDSKLNKAVENIYQEYVQSQEQKGTQIVFSDIGTPGPGKAFTVYDYLKQELITRGVPEEEICFIHDAKKMNRGTAFFLMSEPAEKGLL